jgi:hypothetical protein
MILQAIAIVSAGWFIGYGCELAGKHIAAAIRESKK